MPPRWKPAMPASNISYLKIARRRLEQQSTAESSNKVQRPGGRGPSACTGRAHTVAHPRPVSTTRTSSRRGGWRKYKMSSWLTVEDAYAITATFVGDPKRAIAVAAGLAGARTLPVASSDRSWASATGFTRSRGPGLRVCRARVGGEPDTGMRCGARRANWLAQATTGLECQPVGTL